MSKKKISVTITADENCPKDVIDGLIEVARLVSEKKDKFLKLKKSSDKANNVNP